MKKRQLLKIWSVVLYILSTFVMSIAINAYVNLSIEDGTFIVFLLICSLGYAGAFKLYITGLHLPDYEDKYIDME